LSICNGADSHTGAEAIKDNDEGWLDFKAIKEKADARAVLSHFGLLEHLEERGAELVGWCPFGDEHGKLEGLGESVPPFIHKRNLIRRLDHLRRRDVIIGSDWTQSRGQTRPIPVEGR
jgi:hypothetical protein